MGISRIMCRMESLGINSGDCNLLERTWKQARNETLKVHEMEQLY
jgi:hypothetical protein